MYLLQSSVRGQGKPQFRVALCLPTHGWERTPPRICAPAAAPQQLSRKKRPKRQHSAQWDAAIRCLLPAAETDSAADMKPTNKAERSAAELVERRAGTKGNALW